MDAQALLSGSALWRLAAAALVFAPVFFILFSRRAGRIGKLVWAAATQLPWLFIWVYFSVWRDRYGDPALAPEVQFVQSPIADALGWWMFAFPWAVYLLYRSTRSWFPGEARPKRL